VPPRDSENGPESWSLGRLLSTAARLVEHEWNGWLAERGITHAGLLALDALDEGPLTQRQAAAASRVEEQTMSRVLDRLQRTGHVERRRDTVDRRRLVVTLTPSGREVLDQIRTADIADILVADHLDDAVAFRAELVRLIGAISGPPADAGATHSDRTRPPDVRAAGTGDRPPRPARRSTTRDPG
jgi:MarR family transcriptional regulator, organic hydroperoxide resistance regulator